MNQTKEPLPQSALARIESQAKKDAPFDDWKIFVLMRWCGMHPSVIVEPKYELREETLDDGRIMVVWKRTKKTGRDAYTSIKKSENITFDINEYIKRFQKRKTRRSRVYIWSLIKRIAESVGYADVSPMSYRHSVGVELLSRGLQESEVQQLMNVSRETLNTYVKYANRNKANACERIGW